jgi:hypothetical protein
MQETERLSVGLLETVVVGVENLQDSSGAPVAWDIGLVGELPETVIEELVQRVLLNQSDAAARADPLAGAPPASPSPPSTTTEGGQ